MILLNFWATWCGPGKAEIPGFVELQDKYKKYCPSSGYDVDDTAEKARPFVTEYKMNYPVLLGLGREDVQDAYGPIWGIPASFLISKDGKLCKRHIGHRARRKPSKKRSKCSSCSMILAAVMLKGFTHARLSCGCRLAFREGSVGSPVSSSCSRPRPRVA